MTIRNYLFSLFIVTITTVPRVFRKDATVNVSFIMISRSRVLSRSQILITPSPLKMKNTIRARFAVPPHLIIVYFSIFSLVLA